MAEGDLVVRWMGTLKSNPVVATLVVLAIIVAGLASFTKSVETISEPIRRLVVAIWPPKMPDDVLADARRAASEVRTMNSEKGAMMGALDNYIHSAGSPGSWQALLYAMKQTAEQLGTARKAVVKYNAVRPSRSNDALLRLIDERHALLLPYLTTPPPAPLDKAAAEKLRDEHLTLMNKIDIQFSAFETELKKNR